MQNAIRIMLKRAKQYKAELEARGTTLEAETKRLREAGLLLGQRRSDPQDDA